MSKKKRIPSFYEVSIEKQGEERPFSRGEITTLLNYIGIELTPALKIATRVKRELIKKKNVNKKTGQYSISSVELGHTIKDKLLEAEENGVISPGDQFPEKYIFWRNVRNLREPMLILVGGATAVGTTSIGRSLENKLNFIVQSGTNPFMYELKGMFNIVMTDHIRDTMRGFAEAYPTRRKLEELFVSTYEAGKLKGKGNSREIIDGFIRQTEMIETGLDTIIENDILYRGSSLIVEGIHLIPGYLNKVYSTFLNSDIQDYSFHFHVDIPDEQVHQARLGDRESETTLRGRKDYLGKYDEIRMIKDYLLSQAQVTEIPIISNSELNEIEHKYVSSQIMNHIFERLRYSDRYDIRKGDIHIKK
jgi:2-phosphoglycerate kinase